MPVNVRVNGVVYNDISAVALVDADNPQSTVTFTLSGEGEDGPLYPLTFAGSETGATFGNFNLSVVEPCHMRIVISAGGTYINLKHHTTDISVEDNRSTWFTIPAGEATLKMTNIVNQGNVNYGIAFKPANELSSAASVLTTGQNVQGADVIVNKTFASPVDIGWVGLFVGQNTTGTIEFDLELTIGGVRYI